MDSAPGRSCDVWLWDGSVEYEGAMAKLAEAGFTAHLREAGRPSARNLGGRRFTTTFFDLQRQFVGRRFLCYCKLASEAELQEVEVTSVQRSSLMDFDFFVCGRLHELDVESRETLQKSARLARGTIARRFGTA
ncbi:MAG: hypothetical protein HYY16_11470 [Planctomycetes bacterium]|nr:hypothetical protein [Planctomycetota bacterium]